MVVLTGDPLDCLPLCTCVHASEYLALINYVEPIPLLHALVLLEIHTELLSGMDRSRKFFRWPS